MRVALVLLCALSALSGCAELQTAKRSPLPRAQMSPDSVVLDYFFVRVPLDDPLANGELWNEADEQQLPADLRMRLADHGIRAGLLGSQIPRSLEKLVGQQTAPTSDDPNAIVDFEAEPRVVQRHVQLRKGMTSEILTALEREKLVLLETERGMVGGKTYRKAQGVFQLKSYPQPDGRVRIELAPELHHDEPRLEYVDHQGGWMPEVRRPRRLFPELKMEATLAPGEMAVLTCLPGSSGTLGHHCFTESTTRGLTQKLLIVRLAQTQHVGQQP